MAIQMRRGARADYDPTKIRKGEIVLAVDESNETNTVVGIGKDDAQVLELATKSYVDTEASAITNNLASNMASILEMHVGNDGYLYAEQKVTNI